MNGIIGFSSNRCFKTRLSLLLLCCFSFKEFASGKLGRDGIMKVPAYSEHGINMKFSSKNAYENIVEKIDKRSLQKMVFPASKHEIALTNIFVKPHKITQEPSGLPSSSPSYVPTQLPSSLPSKSSFPSSFPTMTPSITPSVEPSSVPSAAPSFEPSSSPSAMPTFYPSSSPSLLPTSIPSLESSTYPTLIPSVSPSSDPTSTPSLNPTLSPSSLPSSNPSSSPSISPTSIPSSRPSVVPTASSEPSSNPTNEVSAMPSAVPTSRPSSSPSNLPTIQPSLLPSSVAITNQISGKNNSLDGSKKSTKSLMVILLPALGGCVLFGLGLFLANKHYYRDDTFKNSSPSFGDEFGGSDGNNNFKNNFPNQPSMDEYDDEYELEESRNNQHAFQHLDQAIYALKRDKRGVSQFRDSVEEIERGVELLKKNQSKSSLSSTNGKTLKKKDGASLSNRNMNNPKRRKRTFFGKSSGVFKKTPKESKKKLKKSVARRELEEMKGDLESDDLESLKGVRFSVPDSNKDDASNDESWSEKNFEIIEETSSVCGSLIWENQNGWETQHISR